MSIQKGDPIPNARLFTLDESGAPRATPASELFAGKRVSSGEAMLERLGA